MSVEGQKFYPGGDATALDVLMLADEYRRSAEVLLPTGRRGKPLSRSPYRLIAIHAIELYLNALMRSRGVCATAVRRLQHDMAARAKFAQEHGLKFKRTTYNHLLGLASSREYLVSRYEAELPADVSELNRLAATLRQVAEKVSRSVREEPITK